MTGGTTPTQPERERKPPMVGVGMPEALKLEHFGRLVFDAYGWMAYHVGSSFRGKEWRDVDVRVILNDDEWIAEFGEPPRNWEHNPKWVVLCWSLSLLGRDMTDLPIDFQIQPMQYANEKFSEPRNAIGIGWLHHDRERPDA